MAIYQCDKPEAEEALKELERRLYAAGGWLADDLVVRCKNGELSVAFSGEAEGPLVRLTEACLLPVAPGGFRLAGDEIRFTDNVPEMAPETRALFDAKIALFNLTSKIAAHRKTSPWVAFADDTALLEILMRARPNLKFPAQYLADAKAGAVEALTLNSFFKTRTLRFPDGLRVLMPFVNFANHHLAAPEYQFAADEAGKPTITLLKGRVSPDTDESFVQYGPYDALDLYFNYSFTENSAPFVRSVPLQLEVPGAGVTHVNAASGLAYDGALPAALEPLRPFFPALSKPSPNEIHVSHLYVPGPEFPDALRAVLAELAKTLDPGAASAAFVEAAERQVIETNLGFYKDFEKRLSERSGKPEALAAAGLMVKFQLTILEGYTFG